MESTSYPGTTEQEVIKKIKNKFKIGKDFFVGFSSERINPGVNENKISLIPKVVSGHSSACLEIISSIYKQVFIKIVKAGSIKIAEFSKLLENIYRAVNIGFINEMKFVADKMEIDIFDVIKIASTKPYGFNLLIQAQELVGIVFRLILIIYIGKQKKLAYLQIL